MKQNEGNTEDFQYMLTTMGSNIDYASDAWKGFLQSTQAAFEYTMPTLEDMYTTFQKVDEIIDKMRIFVDYFTVFCYNSIVTRYCAQAFDTPGRLGVRPARSRREIVTEPLYRGPTRRRSCLKRMWPEGR